MTNCRTGSSLKEWVAFCESRKYQYFYTFLNFGYIARKLDRVLRHLLSNVLLESDRFLVLYNFIFCEAHSDVQKTIFEQTYQKKWK